MIAASLMLVFMAAKAAALAGHQISASLWMPIALFWQDAAVALIAAGLAWTVRIHRRLFWAIYAAAALYAAINVPVVRAVSTPLTAPMIRAARGPLADSFRYYASWENTALFLSVLALAALAPRLFRNAPGRPVAALLALLAALGPAVPSRIEAAGLERNAWTALAVTALPFSPRTPAGGAAWQVTGFDRAPNFELARFSGAAEGRNVVMVSLESTAAQYLGLYGASPDVAPYLSRLAADGLVFENAYASYPESIKGLFSVLCSVYPAFGAPPEAYASAPCSALPAELRGAGYQTALFHSGRFGYLGMEDVIRNRGFDVMEDAGDIGGNHESSFGVDEPATVARMLRWLDALPSGAKFFAAYLPIAGHHPYESPERGPFADTELFGRYRNALWYGDRSLGALMDGLRERGLEKKTLWIIYGDHGEAFGQHDGDSGHTFQIYEENIHVPLVVAAPGWNEKPLQSSKVVGLVDIAPTTLDLLGLRRPSSYQGQSMLDARPRMALFFADYSRNFLGLRDGARKFIYDVDSNRARLFNLASDPGETRDISAGDPDAVTWYSGNLRNWRDAQSRLLTASTANPLR